MSLEIYITYVFATTLILIIPGPTIILVVSQAVTHGRKSVDKSGTGQANHLKLMLNCFKKKPKYTLY